MNNPSFKYSCDGKIGLAYSKEKTAKTTTKTFSFPACNELRFYTYFAYTYNDLQVKLSEWKDKPLFNINQVLSPKGLNLTYIEIGNNNYTDKKCIVMTTRLHSTEVYSSFYMEGLIEGIDKRFTDNANLLVFPMANPDGVYYGVNHLNAMSQDLNDCWNITSCQEVNRMKEIIASFADRCGGVDMYLDWHGGNAGNPGEDATLYYTDKEREFAIDLQNRTNFKEKGRYTNTPDQSAYYVRKQYGALSFAPEIQHKYEETIHSIPVMIQQGALYAQVISDFYGFKEKSSTNPMPQEPLDYDMEQRYGDWYFYLKPYGWINVQPILDKTIQ
jgi:hypothetical protein